ncbi:MAG: hypothetical protein GY739_18435, partial [Mesoflavibacter sp.]|nr:hypothetical protein [Mesoflavibacter sp.]
MLNGEDANQAGVVAGGGNGVATQADGVQPVADPMAAMMILLQTMQQQNQAAFATLQGQNAALQGRIERLETAPPRTATASQVASTVDAVVGDPPPAVQLAGFGRGFVNRSASEIREMQQRFGSHGFSAPLGSVRDGFIDDDTGRGANLRLQDDDLSTQSGSHAGGGLLPAAAGGQQWPARPPRRIDPPPAAGVGQVWRNDARYADRLGKAASVSTLKAFDPAN